MLVLVRDGCHLCEEAVAIIDAVCAPEFGTEYALRDVDADPDLPAALHRPGARGPLWTVREHEVWRVGPGPAAGRTAARPLI